MVLRTLTGDGPRPYVDLLKRPLDPRQIFLAGTRDLDPDEAAFIERSDISVTRPDALVAPHALSTAIRARGFRHVYLHLDLDCFRSEEIPDTLMHAPGGPSLDSVAAAHHALRNDFTTTGFSIVEYVNRNGGSLEKLQRFHFLSAAS